MRQSSTHSHRRSGQLFLGVLLCPSFNSSSILLLLSVSELPLPHSHRRCGPSWQSNSWRQLEAEQHPLTSEERPFLGVLLSPCLNSSSILLLLSVSELLLNDSHRRSVPSWVFFSPTFINGLRQAERSPEAEQQPEAKHITSLRQAEHQLEHQLEAEQRSLISRSSTHTGAAPPLGCSPLSFFE